MQRLSLILLSTAVFFFAAFQLSESPHGKDFDIDCAVCHSTEGWTLDKDNYSFDHNSTQFPLIGQHQSFNCRGCHPTLVFNEAHTECISCHSDIHEQTVGMECEKCHTPHNWLVSNITEIHQLSRFPLIGPHSIASCSDCHMSASLLRFEPLGIECIDCHQDDYLTATNPNHVENNYSTNCTDCHAMYAFTWTGSGIDHGFFPLREGHNISDCSQCHTPGVDYSNISSECFACHEPDYNATENPGHVASGFSTECNSCHSLAPGWKPADFSEHDGLYFPIFSGEHNGEWNSCMDCHNNVSTYSLFTCIDCHEHNKADMDDEHDDVNGYVYESLACFGCHPTGDADEGFNHNSTAFSLTGAHLQAACSDCHSMGYNGTPTDCFACHETDFNQSVNPGHVELGLDHACELCHTTQDGWKPATFAQHNNYYVLLGAHAVIANNCADCHNGQYNNTPNSCFGCHEEEYNQANNPPHLSSQLPTDCELCHTQSVWEPSIFNHDGMYFPIYSGKHDEEWDACVDCHINPGNYAIFSCIDCHEHFQPEMDEEHEDVPGYQYNSIACLECHPDGNEPMRSKFMKSVIHRDD